MFTRKIFSGVALAGITFYIIGSFSQGRPTKLGVTAAFAQGTSATIYGTATDAKGALVPGVKVTAVNDSVGIQREAITNTEGAYNIPLLPAGNYTVTAEMPGFATLRLTDVVLRVSINSNVPIVLEPKQIAETVSVAAETNKVDTSNATLAYSVTNEQVRGLPVFTSVRGRTVLDVLPFLVPGVSPTEPFGSTVPGTNIRGEGISINGARPNSIGFNFEGADNNDHEQNRAASPLPNPDALQEFTVVTNNYQADLGRSSGGVINATAKSGTNELHGNFRYFLRNEALNARSFFQAKRGLDRLNTFGGNIGGPAYLPRFGEGRPALLSGRGRTFFFFDIEGNVSRRGFPSQTVVPTMQERGGDFSAVPVGLRPRDPLNGQPFPNGQIPGNRINPISRAYVERYIPLPNQSGTFNFARQLQTVFRNNQFTVRIDHKVSDADSLSGTYFFSDSENDSETQELPVGSSLDLIGRNHNIVLRETHVFSTRTVNQLTLGATRFVEDSRWISPGADGIHPSEIGFTGVRPQTERYLSLPGVSFLGTSLAAINAKGSPGTTQYNSAKTTWQIKDDLSHVRGDHALKLGGEVRSFIFNKSLESTNGVFRFSPFNPVGTRNAIADFLLGIANEYRQSTGNNIYPRQKAYYFYAMDDWRLRPNLTVNLGLRYELTPPLTEERDQVLIFRPGAMSQRFPSAREGVLYPGDPDPILRTVPRGGYPTDKNNFAPRVGIAYSPKPQSGWLRSLLGDGETSIRAGWGVFYDQTFGYNFTEVTFTPPFSVSQRFTAQQIRNAGGTFANPFGSLPNPWPIDLSQQAFSTLFFDPNLQPFDPTFSTAYTYQYNLTVQRQLPLSLLLELGYVGNNTFKLNRERELNAAVVGPGATSNVFNIDDRRIYSQFGSIPQQESSGRSRYDSLQIRVTRRLERGLSFDGSYVYGKGLDNGSYASPALDLATASFGRLVSESSGWARSGFNRKHNFVVSHTYDFPTIGRGGIVGRIVNGWQIGGITQFRSGLPVDIINHIDSTLTGGVGRPDFVGPYVRFDWRERRTINIIGIGPVTGHFFLDPNAFRAVTPADHTQARPGTLGRNVFDGPGVNQWALSLVKKTRIAESHEIEVRADINNLLNHAQFGGYNQIVGGFFGSSFGQGFGAGPGRTIQVSARYSF